MSLSRRADWRYSIDRDLDRQTDKKDDGDRYEAKTWGEYMKEREASG